MTYIKNEYIANKELSPLKIDFSSLIENNDQGTINIVVLNSSNELEFLPTSSLEQSDDFVSKALGGSFLGNLYIGDLYNSMLYDQGFVDNIYDISNNILQVLEGITPEIISSGSYTNQYILEITSGIYTSEIFFITEAQSHPYVPEIYDIITIDNPKSIDLNQIVSESFKIYSTDIAKLIASNNFDVYGYSSFFGNIYSYRKNYFYDESTFYDQIILESDLKLNSFNNERVLLSSGNYLVDSIGDYYIEYNSGFKIKKSSDNLVNITENEFRAYKESYFANKVYLLSELHLNSYDEECVLLIDNKLVTTSVNNYKISIDSGFIFKKSTTNYIKIVDSGIFLLKDSFVGSIGDTALQTTTFSNAVDNGNYYTVFCVDLINISYRSEKMITFTSGSLTGSSYYILDKRSLPFGYEYDIFIGNENPSLSAFNENVKVVEPLKNNFTVRGDSMFFEDVFFPKLNYGLVYMSQGKLLNHPSLSNSRLIFSHNGILVTSLSDWEIYTTGALLIIKKNNDIIFQISNSKVIINGNLEVNGTIESSDDISGFNI